MAERLQLFWRELNARFFRSALPPIAIAWSRRLTASAGMFVSRVGPRARAVPGQTWGGSRMIRLSVPLLHGQSEQEIRRTLAHEMIHQWQFDVLKQRPSHGPAFHRMKDVLNRDGYEITVCHSLDDAVRGLTRYAWRCLQCGAGYHRRRRTIRPTVHRCGTCRGPLREIHPGLSDPMNGTVRREGQGGRRPCGRDLAQLQLPYEGG